MKKTLDEVYALYRARSVPVAQHLQPGLEAGQVRSAFKKAGVPLPDELLAWYTFANGTAPNARVAKDALAFFFQMRILPIEEATKRYSGVAAKPAWKRSWWPVMVHVYNPRQAYVYDCSARATPSVLAVAGAQLKPMPLFPHYDNLKALAGQYLRGYKENLMVKQGPWPQTRNAKRFQAIYLELNPVASNVGARTQEETLRKTIQRLSRTRRPKGPEAVERLVKDAEAIASADDPKAVSALLQVVWALEDLGAQSAVIELLGVFPNKRLVPAIEEKMKDRNFRQVGARLLDLFCEKADKETHRRSR